MRCFFSPKTTHANYKGGAWKKDRLLWNYSHQASVAVFFDHGHLEFHRLDQEMISWHELIVDTIHLINISWSRFNIYNIYIYMFFEIPVLFTRLLKLPSRNGHKLAHWLLSRLHHQWRSHQNTAPIAEWPTSRRFFPHQFLRSAMKVSHQNYLKKNLGDYQVTRNPKESMPGCNQEVAIHPQKQEYCVCHWFGTGAHIQFINEAQSSYFG